METFLQSILLGVVEGLTEFLPVSSTGHLILLIDILKFKGPEGKVFEIAIQLGAILAICWLFRQKLIHVVASIAKDLPRAIARTSSAAGRRRRLKITKEMHFALCILLAFLPSAILGVLFHDFIKHYLFSPYVVCTSLILGGIIILMVEREHIEPTYKKVDKFPLRLALYIGLCQALAMIPGTSRSGATIIGALLLKVERKAAAEFSFFLAIPTMLSATAYDLYKNAATLDSSGMELIAVGFVSAFIAALLVVRWLMRFISTHGFALFGWYRIALGSLMLALLSLR